MNHSLSIYNSLSRKKEVFTPIHPERVGMYVCGPTVYGDPHLGHARAGICFDIIFRYLLHLGYKVRYVRNITDVGHLENDADEGEDKIAKKAKLEQLEPMEVAQYYTNRYHNAMDRLAVLRPSIEPHATGHIMEQIEVIRQIMEAGYAYEKNGSVYFDVIKYNKDYKYGKLSGRLIEDLLSTTRENLASQDEKINSADFALWKKAKAEHLMRWDSPWSVGFPGWHTECTAMSCKYLGKSFDIHGGGMDLLFPHHEAEMAQSNAAYKKDPCNYWVHNNMITINGQKMGKSLGNFISLDELFTGKHASLEKEYHPMTIRFFILQAHYRSTLDFSNEALLAAEKGLKRLLQAYKILQSLNVSDTSTVNIQAIEEKAYQAMDDDFNTPIALAQFFELVRLIHSAVDKKEHFTQTDKDLALSLYKKFIFDIMGIREEQEEDGKITEGLIELLLELRQEAKIKKDYASSDAIRDKLAALGIKIKDGKDGCSWELA